MLVIFMFTLCFPPLYFLIPVQLKTVWQLTGKDVNQIVWMIVKE